MKTMNSMNSKTDLVTSIFLAIVGAVIAYFVCGFFIGEIEPYSYTTIDSSFSTDLAEPNVEVFNYKALNPTVEVYVGECDEFDENGECIDEDSEDIINIEEDVNIKEDTEIEPGEQENP